MNIKMIVTDLDNTLLRTDKTVSDYTRDVFKRCRERGILFAHATSRSIAASQQFADITRPDIRITCGGALATSADTEPYKAAFTQNETTHLLRSFAAESAVRQITMVSETSYYTSIQLTGESVSKGFYNSICIPRDEMADKITEPALKFTIDCMNMSVLKMACSQVESVVLTQFSGETWIAVAKIGAQKHLALTAVIEQLGIAPCEVAVFGDDYNDIDMLSLPGVVSVAVENAIDEVKAVASQICGDCDEDGVAKWIEGNVL